MIKRNGLGWCLLLSLAAVDSSRAQGPGRVLWEFDAPAALQSPAVADDGSVYAISGAFFLHALESSGLERWRTNVAGLLLVPPAIMGDGTILLTELNRDLIALNPDGTEKWRFHAYVAPNVPDSLQNLAPPALAADGTIYFCAQLDQSGQPNFRFFALNSDGVEQWSFRGTGAGYSAPAIASDGSIYLARGNRLYCFQPGGFKEWEAPLGTTGSLNDGAGHLAIDSSGIVYVAADKLYAINPDGTMAWASDPGAGTTGTPILAPDGTIYIHGGVRDVNSAFIFYQTFGLSPNGAIRYLSPGRSSPEAPTGVGVDGTIFTTPGASGVCALWPTLASKWCMPWSVSPVLTPGGRLYAVSNQRLTAYQTSCGLARSAWPMSGRDPRHTGRTGSWPPVNPCLTALRWNPVRGFQFTVTAEPGRSYLVQASSNLVDWDNLFSFTAAEAVSHLTDSAAASGALRFYRVVLL